MEILIGFLIALGIITSGDNLTQKQVEDLSNQYHQKLEENFGQQYITLVGHDINEKD